MTQRTAVVTGAARGIGAAVARRLADEGLRVVCVDRCHDDPAFDYPLARREQLEQVVAECGDAAAAVVADVGDRTALEAALEGVPHLDHLDAIVCAAGVVWGGPALWDTPIEVSRSLLVTNVEGVLNTAAVLVPRLLERPEPRQGRFVAIASAAGERGLPRMGVYAATKHAVVGLVRSLAADLADTGVTANVVSPGCTDTPILAASAEVYGLGSVEEFAEHHTIGRLLEPGEVADAVAWLCSPSASAVTGAVLAVDGGMTAT